MIEAVVGLLMFINGEIKEARLQDSMAMCLRGKREAERTVRHRSADVPQCDSGTTVSIQDPQMYQTVGCRKNDTESPAHQEDVTASPWILPYRLPGHPPLATPLPRQRGCESAGGGRSLLCQ